MSRSYNPNKARVNRTYTVRELMRLYRVVAGTISAWVSDGLRPCDGKRPYLFRGEDVRAYINRRRSSDKRPCGPGQIYCVACKAVKTPAGASVVCRPVCSKSANLIGDCPTCCRPIFRRVSIAKIGGIIGKLNIRYEDQDRYINGYTSDPHTQRGAANG